MNIELKKIEGKYPYKSKKKRLVRKWEKAHTKRVAAFKDVELAEGSTITSLNFTYKTLEA